MYYLTETPKRKNGKRHILEKSEDIDKLRERGKRWDAKRYLTDIYTGSWKLVEHVNY